MFNRSVLRLSLALLLCLSHFSLVGAPFDREIEFTQPDGTVITVRGRGDEFYAVFETLQGYTVVFDPALKAYCYARQAFDGGLESTGLMVHRVTGAETGLAPHIRMSAEARKRIVVERYQQWNTQMQVAERWNALKASARLAESVDSGVLMGPPSFTTLGVKVGLTLLVDFSDAPGTISQAEIINFCNSDSYTTFGNNGSVKSYFFDNSNGLLTYTNVVTVYIRAPRPKSYYNDTTKDCGLQSNVLIKDVLDALKALPNYTSQILPTFAPLTSDSGNRVVAMNVFYAGGDSGVWSKGLWPNSGSLYNAGAQPLGNGKSVYRYQITNIGSSLALGTFCHENGHMLCGYPDIYDYDYDSTGGAGMFCLMNSGGSGGNPTQICAYLKRASGWATVVDINSTSQLFGSLTATAGPAFNRFYRFRKPGVATEYYLLENRQRIGRDARLPAGGIAIWHIDELGNRDNQSTNYNTLHQNYEVSLMQADNQYHLQRDINSGDSSDLFYSGNTSAAYRNTFSDTTGPSARWWDGSNSGMYVDRFSSSGATMTFRIGQGPPALSIARTTIVDANGNGQTDYNETNLCWVVLRNDGVETATNVTVTLSTTASGVTVVESTSTYADVAPGGTVTNITPLVIYTAPEFVCGTPVLVSSVASCVGRQTTSSFFLPAAIGTCVDGSLLAPVVTLDAPTNGSIFQISEPITLSATASDPDSQLIAVEFYDGPTRLATIANPPFTFEWTNAAIGRHVITAKALDNTGLFAKAVAAIGIADPVGPMRWVGGASDNKWGEPFNWSLCRTPTNGEPVVFDSLAQPFSTNDTLTALGNVRITASGLVMGGNTITLLDGITNAGNTTWAVPTRLGAVQTLVSQSGVLSLNAPLTNNSYMLTLDGAGDISARDLLVGGGGLTKNGTGTLTLWSRNLYTGPTIINAGKVVLKTGGSIGTIRGTVTVQTNATLQCDVADALGYGPSRVSNLTINNGTFTHAASGFLPFWGMTINLYGARLQAISGGGVLDLGTDSNAGNAATAVNCRAHPETSTISAPQLRLRQQNTYFNVEDGPPDIDLQVSGPIISVTANSGIVKSGTGTMLLTSASTYTGPTTVSGGRLIVNGSLGTNTVAVLYGAAIGGSGVIGGALNVGNGAVVSPGEGFGFATLTASNSVSLAGTAKMNISKKGTELANSRIRCWSRITYSGTLEVTGTGDDLAEGDSFQLFTANDYAGQFAGFGLPMVVPPLAWDVSRLAVDGSISVARPPAVSLDPTNLAVATGQPASFAVVASGTAVTYQWRKDGSGLAGETQAEFTIPFATVLDSGTYDVVIANGIGSVTSAPAVLTVVSEPVIAVQPAGLSLVEGQSGTLQVEAQGLLLSYQWRKDATELNGATGPQLQLSSVTPGDAGNYDVVVSNLAGSAYSDVAVVTVTSSQNPALSISVVNNTIFISWLPDAQGFILQASLDVDSGSWTDLTETSAGSWSEPAAAESARFFRLIKR